MPNNDRIAEAENRNRLITIQACTRVPDENGDQQETWSTVCTPWASIKPLSGREMWVAKQAQSRVSHRISIIYRTGITAEMRALLGSRVFNFESVINVDEQNQELEILATEVV